MADTTELYASRWNSGLDVSGGPGLNDLEAVIKLITGIPFATVISGGLGLDEECRFGKHLWTRHAVGGSQGVRIQDTAGDDVLVSVDDDLLIIYENTGTEGTPVWTKRFMLPTSLGPIAAKTERGTTTGWITASSGFTIPFLAGVYEHGITLDHATAATKIIVPKKGIYSVMCACRWTADNTGDRSCQIWKNGSVTRGVMSIPAISSVVGQWTSCSTDLEMDEDDYVEMQVIHTSTNNCAVEVSEMSVHLIQMLE